jgi:hypothetical protein
MSLAEVVEIETFDATPRVDPTGTLRLRVEFRRSLEVRLQMLRTEMRKVVAVDDMLGLGTVNLAALY